MGAINEVPLEESHSSSFDVFELSDFGVLWAVSVLNTRSRMCFCRLVLRPINMSVFVTRPKERPNDDSLQLYKKHHRSHHILVRTTWMNTPLPRLSVQLQLQKSRPIGAKDQGISGIWGGPSRRRAMNRRRSAPEMASWLNIP